MAPRLAWPYDHTPADAPVGATRPSPPSSKISNVTVTDARSELEWEEGLRFCAAVYERTYATGWVTRPDALFIARDQDGPAATIGIELGRLRPRLDIERFYVLSPQTQAFVDANRERTAELGRFASSGRADRAGTRAVLRAALRHCQHEGVEYLFACARTQVARHVEALGVPFWAVDAPLNQAEIRSRAGLSAPPTSLFVGPQPAQLHIVLIPFLERAIDRLADTSDHIHHADG